MIAGVIKIMITMAHDISGAGFNPSIAIGINLVMWADSGDAKPLMHLWLYILMPLLSSVITTFAFDYLWQYFPPELIEESQKAQKEEIAQLKS